MTATEEQTLNCLLSMFEGAGGETESCLDDVYMFLNRLCREKRAYCLNIAVLVLSSFESYSECMVWIGGSENIEETDLPFFRINAGIVKQKHTPDLMTRSVYGCKKCGSKNVKVTQRQTRSADEGMTEFISCIVCGFVRRTHA